MACRVRGISSSYRRSGSSPACRRSTSVAKRDERGRTRAFHRLCKLADSIDEFFAFCRLDEDK
jgi:hypothetical protein